MARTLVQIRKEIDELQREAEKVEASEVAAVIQRIKSAIAFYGLTADDLFDANAKSPAKSRKASSASKRKTRKAASLAKYRDKESGKTWTGHGKRPGWFVQAIANGVKAEDMAA